MSLEPIPARFFAQAKLRPDAPASYVRVDGHWQKSTFRQRVDEVRRIAKALVALDVQRPQATCILGYNRPEWVAFHLATMAIGATPAGIYTTCSSDQVRYIVDHAEAPVIVVDSEEQLGKIERERSRLPQLRHVVLMPSAPERLSDGERILGWASFLAKGDAVPDSTIDERLHALSDDQPATVIYTSGTTGPPKAVLLSHKNLAWTADLAARLVHLGPSDRLFSYLPLSHIAEQMFTIYGPACAGTPVYFSRGPETVPEDLKEVQPTVLFGVPRVWEKLKSAVSTRMAEVAGPKALMLKAAMDIGRRAVEKRNRGAPLGRRLGVAHAIAQRLVLGPALQKMGLGSARLCITGAAPTPRAVIEFFAGLDLSLHEVYGQSEASGPTSFNLPGNTRYGTVGTVIPGVEVRIDTDGEILVRGPNVFLGYAKDAEATRESFSEGWLKSGDLGAFDGDGFLTITGRKKEVIITAGGKNITPSLIEEGLKSIDLVSDAVVIGDGRRFLVALIVPDPAPCQAFLTAHGDTRPPHQSSKLREHLEAAVGRVNEKLGRVEQIKRFCILPRPLDIEQGELTPTLKVRRKVVEEHFAAEIENLYGEPDQTAQRAVSHTG
jgi:long-chain acyl-CoA synthetase